jgi:hypothetical protein
MIGRNKPGYSFVPSAGVAFFLATCCMILWSSCAQIVPPSGGKPDTRPPHARKYEPDSAAVHFHSKTVEIQFDEFIQLKDLNSQLIISPPMEKTPDIRVKNKSLLIEFREPLKDSTTYTINFGTALQDVHEGNPLTNFRYVFSTGAYVDSLTLSGKVTNALTLVPEKGVMVMLYEKLDDSVPYKRLPSYFSRTDANGNYQIANIKPATYKVFALRDANNNYKCNADEMIGFRDQVVNLNHSDTANLVLFKEDVKIQRIKRVYQAGHGKILFVFDKPVEGFKVRPLNCTFGEGEKINVEYNTRKDSVTFWFGNPKLDSLILEVRDKDKVYDTLRYKLITREKMLSQRKGKKASLSVKLNVVRNPFDLETPILFEFDDPVLDFSSATPEKLILTEDTSRRNLFSKGLFSYANKEKNMRVYSWKDTAHVIKESKKYHLTMLPGAFKDMFGFYNDTMKVEFHTQELKYYGTLKLNMHAPAGKYVLQLLDENDGIVRESLMKGDQELYYEFVPPGKYRMRLIYDANANGKWDTGNYLKHEQPEHVIYNIQTVTIRSNWDQEVDWFIK